MSELGFKLCPDCGCTCLPKKAGSELFRWECGCHWYSAIIPYSEIDNIEIPDEFDELLWKDINGLI